MEGNKKVYLADFFGHKDRVGKYSKELNDLGIRVTARWYNEKVPHTVNILDLPDAYHQETARADVEDIQDADYLVLFSGTDKDYADIPARGLARGGRHFETGYALALGKKVIVCGDKENVFHHLPQIVQIKTWEEVKNYLCQN